MADAIALLCRSLLERVGLDDIWGSGGPTTRATALLEADGGKLAPAQRALLLVAWALWNGRGNLLLSELIRDLGPDHLRAVAEALTLYSRGYEAVARWVSSSARGPAHEPPPVPGSAMIEAVVPEALRELPSPPTEAELGAALLASFSHEPPPSFKKLARRTIADGVTDVRIESTQDLPTRRRLKGIGLLTVTLEWSDDPDDSPGSATLPFSFEGEQQQNRTIAITSKRVDTSEFAR